MKTIWMWYLIMGEEVNPRLYAFTDSKSEAITFRMTRNLKLFNEKKMDVDKNEWLQLNSYFSYARLYNQDLTTKGLDDFSTSKIRLLLTTEEIHSVLLKTEDILPDKFRNCMMDVSCFNNDILEALYNLGYFYIYKWLEINQYIYKPLDKLFAGIDNELTSLSTNIKYDEFALFMHLYGRTMNLKEER